MVCRVPQVDPRCGGGDGDTLQPQLGGITGAEKVDTCYGELLSTAERCQRNFAKHRIWRMRLLTTVMFLNT